jgi:DNA repair protein RadC
MDISNHSMLPDKDLLKRLLNIPKKDMVGNDIRGILENLQNHPKNTEKVQLICEVAERYGEKRLQSGQSFKNSVQIYDHFHLRFSSLKKEMFLSIILDNKHKVIKEQTISIGILNKSIVHPREVFSPAVSVCAAAIIIIHNHPSCDPKPSSADINITDRLVNAGKIIGIEVLDHVIIGGDRYFSFVDEDIMPG